MFKKALLIIVISSVISGCAGDTESNITCGIGFTTDWRKHAYFDAGGTVSWKTDKGWSSYKMIPGEQCYQEKK